MSEKNKTNNQNSKKFLYEIFDQNWDRDFLVNSSSNEHLTYNDFLKNVFTISKNILNKGITKNDIICTLMENSLETLQVLFSALIIGIVIVPIDTERGKEERNSILKSINPKLIITNISGIVTIKTENISEILKNEEEHKNKKELLSILKKINPEKDFLITYTSGSTGRPKGVVHSFNNLFINALEFNSKFNFNKNNVFLHNFPMSYMAGILNLFILPLISSSKIIITKRFELSQSLNFWQIPIKFNVNTFWFTPTIIGLLLKFDRDNKGKKYCNKNNILGCVGTAHLNQSNKMDFEKKYGFKIFESYGQSETLFLTTNSPNFESNGVGELLSSVKIKFKKKEILISTPWMFKKYTSSNQKILKNNFFHTGDFGEFDENHLKIIGRKKEIIIKGGMNLNPLKIENLIRGMKYFDDVCILGFSDKIIGEKIVCFLQGPNNLDQSKQINKKIVQDLGKDFHVDEFVYIDSFPKTISGKMDKSIIREIYSKK
jgi:long-chain acyl-CoA synthetase